VFFAVATLYRLYVKVAAALYLPLLLVDMPSRGRLRTRTSSSSEDSGQLKNAVLQTTVAGLALVGLMGLKGNPEIQAVLAAWLNENLLDFWNAAKVSVWMPKSVLSLLLLQAASHLCGIASEAMARSARVGTRDTSPSAVASRWIEIARVCYFTHAVLIFILLVVIFTALAPNAIIIAREMWNYLFG
jgi:hypothetical protein